jgi:uncharacterized membrane protein
MVIIRVIGGALPQILILLVFGTQLGLFGGWNNATLEFLGLLAVLFLFSPIVTAALLIIETVRYRKIGRGQGRPSWRMLGLAIFLFVEALVVDGFILSRLGWWLEEVGFGM